MQVGYQSMPLTAPDHTARTPGLRVSLAKTNVDIHGSDVIVAQVFADGSFSRFPDACIFQLSRF